MRFSWGLRWLVLLTVLAVIGVAATLGIGHFRYGTDRARETEFRLAEVHSAAYAANASEWSLVAHGRADRADAEAFTRDVAAIRTKLSQIATSDPAAVPVLRRVTALLGRYDRAVAIELSALRNGDVSEALAIDAQRVDPTFDQIDGVLTRAISTSEARRAAAERHAILAARLIVISAAIGMLIAICLFARARRRVHERGFEADHDELTGLLNRRGFFACLDETIAGRDARVAVLLLDLDGFKEINDTLGHASGDALLRQIGARLRGALRERD